MQFFENEGKQILKGYGIKVPRFFALIKSADEITNFEYPLTAKVQILQGRRGKSGGVKTISDQQDLEIFCQKFIGQMLNDETVDSVMAEEEMPEGDDFYISIFYSQKYNSPVVMINAGGGINVEQGSSGANVSKISVVDRKYDQKSMFDRLNLSQAQTSKLETVISFLVKCFFEEDLRLLEINPLRWVGGEFVALDAKLASDDRANFRHDRMPVEEIERRKNISNTELQKQITLLNARKEYGGTPCKYVPLDGDVATMLSGGGASLVVFDDMIRLGLEPANYSEYSGNPRAEKVEGLARVVLSQKNIRGLLIAGAVANFTRIDESMKGVIAALQEFRPNFPIVIRRGGPGEDEARKMIEACAQELNLDISWFGSETTLSSAINKLAEKLQKNV